MKHDLSQYAAIAPIAPVAISPIHSLSREWVKDLMFIMGGANVCKIECLTRLVHALLCM